MSVTALFKAFLRDPTTGKGVNTTNPVNLSVSTIKLSDGTFSNILTGATMSAVTGITGGFAYAWTGSFDQSTYEFMSVATTSGYGDMPAIQTGVNTTQWGGAAPPTSFAVSGSVLLNATQPAITFTSATFTNGLTASGVYVANNISVGNDIAASRDISAGRNLSIIGNLAPGQILTNLLYATNGSMGTWSINGVLDNAQTGDNFARIGLNGAGLSAIPGMATTANQATILTNIAAIPTTAAPTASANASATAAQITTDHGTGSYYAGASTAPPVQQIDAQLSGTHGSGAWGGAGGSGALSVVIPVNDTASAALQNVRVSMTLNANIYQATTDASGHASFNLDAGTYAAAATYPGYQSTGNSYTVTLAGLQSPAIVMTAITVPGPTNPSDCRLYGYLYDQAGIIMPLASVNWTLGNAASNVGRNSGLIQTDTTGYCYLDVTLGSGPYTFVTPINNKPTATSVNTTNSTFRFM